MIKDFVEAWDKNKGKLEKYFRKTEQIKYGSYSAILIALIEKVINPYAKEKYGEYTSTALQTSKMTIIDDGDYQGTQIFIIPYNTYQPSLDEYVYTHNYYGSCSGCDTLLGISEYDEGLPDEEQVQGYMTLSLHLLQKFKKFEE